MWSPAAQWEALKSAERCGMCDDAHLPANEHSVLVATTDTSYVRLARNQAHPGYCLVILREHVTDLAELSPQRLTAFWSDVQRAGRAIGEVFQPEKIDYLIMGHRMPHLHCHLLPQHAADDPLRNVDIADGPVFASTAAIGAAVTALQHTWNTTTTSC
ncbi:HIT family protein [Humibacter ginsenosidimutans]|uniref:HIT family protein n=1 Tax=Humibacter ginsenosidimutans TaxID=2599293 RepID=UPI00143DBD8E|nr:HIT family protein [Humibacter ginsenosidimutans]